MTVAEAMAQTEEREVTCGGRTYTVRRFPDGLVAVYDKGGKRDVGFVTSAFFSPQLKRNIALAWLPNSHNELGTKLTVALPGEKKPVPAEVVPVPFVDPNKVIPAA